jgi:hypothetical protein
MNEVCQVVKETHLGIFSVDDDTLLCTSVGVEGGVPDSLVKIFILIFCFMWVWKFVFHIQGTCRWRVFRE